MRCRTQSAECVRVFAPEDAAYGEEHLGNFPKDCFGGKLCKGFSLPITALNVRVCLFCENCVREFAQSVYYCDA